MNYNILSAGAALLVFFTAPAMATTITSDLKPYFGKTCLTASRGRPVTFSFAERGGIPVVHHTFEKMQRGGSTTALDDGWRELTLEPDGWWHFYDSAANDIAFVAGPDENHVQLKVRSVRNDQSPPHSITCTAAN